MEISSKNLADEVTIITISKADMSGLGKTVQSLQNQSYQFWNLIIVLPDNQDISYQFALNLSISDPRVKLICSPEQGIYQSMNCALEDLNYGYVWFMNGGDQFATYKSLEIAYREIVKSNVGVLIGGYQIMENQKVVSFTRSSREISPRRFSLNVRSGNHQAMIFALKEFPKIKFDVNYSIAADFKFVLQVLIFSKGMRINEVLSEIESGGVSNLRISEVWSQKQNIRKEVFGHPSIDSLLGLTWTLGVKFKTYIKSFADRS